MVSGNYTATIRIVKMKKLPEINENELLDIDIRFLLANERTLLAWVRTGLALIAGGIALTQLGEQAMQKSIAGIIVIFMGGVMTLIGLIRFKSADHAIRRGHLPEVGRGPQFQVVAVISLAVILISIELISIL